MACSGRCPLIVSQHPQHSAGIKIWHDKGCIRFLGSLSKSFNKWLTKHCAGSSLEEG